MFPDLPCLSERFPGFVLEAWNGYVGPPGMAPELVAQIAKATIAASKHPMVVERLNALGLFPVGSSPAEFAQTIARDRTFYADAIKAAKL
jgi:tripartite-type tricarboxylate transporter receptor subunit TctC